MNTVTIVAAYLDRKPMGGQHCFRPERQDA